MVNFGMSAPGHPACLQKPDELSRFIDFLLVYRVRSYLEVGARYGGTFKAVMQALPKGSVGLAVDLPGAAFGDKHSEASLRSVCKALRKDGRNAWCLFGSSQNEDVIAWLSCAGPFDVIFIDADHRYEAVKKDWLVYRRMGRIICLHDIAAPKGHKNRFGECVEVPRLWNSIKRSRKMMTEIVSPGSVMGIGIVKGQVPWTARNSESSKTTSRDTSSVALKPSASLA